jgi:hypothetical protein
MSTNSLPIEGEFTLFRPKTFGKGLRRHRRYRTALATFGTINFSAGSECETAYVQNVSKTGIGLNMAKALEVGSQVTIRWRVGAEREPRLFSLRVIHSTLESDRSWRIGCEFAEPLSSDLLELLLQ